MVKCLFCGKEVYLPFKCPYCDQSFCISHRLPENHECKNLWKAKVPQEKKKSSPPPVTSPVGEDDEPSPL